MKVRQAIYTDGGIVGPRNPSPIGASWAWVLVEDEKAIAKDSGVIRANGVPRTNNEAEYYAALQALEFLPDRWAGKFYLDSQVTLGRLFWGWKNRGIVGEWLVRAFRALDRLGIIEPVLLQGHPTKSDLLDGTGKKRGLPVSKWNVFVDSECKKAAEEFLKKHET